MSETQEMKDERIWKERLWTCPKPECRSTLRRHYESNFDTGEKRTICTEYCEVEGCDFIHHFLEPKQELEEKTRIEEMVANTMDDRILPNKERSCGTSDIAALVRDRRKEE